MRTGIARLDRPRAGARSWPGRRTNRLGWQLYDEKGRPAGEPGSAKSEGKGVAAIVDKSGNFILIR